MYGLTSDKELADLRAKLTGVEIESDTEVSADHEDGKVEAWTISAEKMAELKAAARNLSLNIDKLTPQLKLILLVEAL